MVCSPYASRSPIMRRNDYDQASRFAAKLGPAGFLEWALRLGPPSFRFEEWLDTRAVPFPGDTDRTGDTVARLANLAAGGQPWAIAIEFQVEPDSLMFGRLLGYLAAIWQARKPDRESGSRFHVGAVLVNLTGRGDASRDMEWEEAGLGLRLKVQERNLATESADELLTAIEAGSRPRTLLPWMSLMTGGDESAIIERWKRAAEVEPNLRRRADYAAPAVALAEAAGRKSIWVKALEGWNVYRATIVDEWLEQRREEDRAGIRAMLLRLGKKRFGRSPSKKQAAELQAITDPARLLAIGERLLDVNTWSELLASQ